MDRLMQAPVTDCLTKAGAAVGTTTTTTIANDTTYRIKGKIYKKTAASNIASPTTDAVTLAAFPAIPVSYGAVLLIGLNAAGSVKFALGPSVPLDVNNKFITAPMFPGLPDDFAPYAYVTILVGSTASAWTAGTSNFSGPPTGVVFNFVDIGTLPDRLQVA